MKSRGANVVFSAIKMDAGGSCSPLDGGNPPLTFSREMTEYQNCKTEETINLGEAPVIVAATPPRRRSPSALRHVFSNWTGFACVTIVAFFVSPVVVHHLGNSAYGLWVLIASLTGYLGLLNGGLGTAVTRYMAKFHADGNDREANAIASSALAISLVAGTIVILASPVLAALVVRVFHISEGYHFAARAIIILAGFNIAVALISGVFSGTVTGLHRFDLFNLIGVINGLLSASVIVLVLRSGKGLISLAIISLAFAMLTALMHAVVAFRLYPTLKIRLADCDKQHVKLICSFGTYALLLQISFNLIFYTDSMIIGAFLSIGLITFFAIAGNLINYSRALIGGISALITPRASALGCDSGLDEMQTLLMKASRFATMVMLPIAITFFLRGTSFIRLWMGQEYGDLSGRILCILTLALIFIPSDQVATSTMLGIGKHRLAVAVIGAEAVCNLVLSIALIRPMGILGVAWGTTLPSLAVSLLFWPWYVKRTLAIPIRTYVISTWLRPAVAMVPFGLLTFLIEKRWAAPNSLVFFIQIGLIMPAAALAYWYLCFNPFEREKYSQRFVQPILRTVLWN